MLEPTGFRVIRGVCSAALVGVLCLLAGCGGGGAASGADSSAQSSGGEQLPLGRDQDSDPVVVDKPIAFIRRDLASVNVQDDDSNASLAELLPAIDPDDPLAFAAAGNVFIKDRAATSSAMRNITEGLAEFAPVPEASWELRDLQGNVDGTQLVFAVRFVLPEEAEPAPTWNLWIYDLASDQLQRVISSDLVAESGDDINPAFLADGRVVFASTRAHQTRAILLDEGKPQYLPRTEQSREVADLNLHVTSLGGVDLTQLTFNPSHDFSPFLLDNGRVIFTRWDAVDGHDRFSLYCMNPDGTAMSPFFGYHQQQSETMDPVRYIDPRQLENGEILVRLIGDENAFEAALPAVIAEDGTATLGGLDALTEDTATGLKAIALFERELGLSAAASAGGRYQHFWPFYDGSNRLLTSWSQCRLSDPLGVLFACTEARLQDPMFTAASPAFSVWVLDPEDDTQLPVVVAEQGAVYTDPVALTERNGPVLVLPSPDEPTLVEPRLGVLNISNVYDLAGVDTSPLGVDVLANPALSTVADREVLFLRLVKSVLTPDQDTLQIPGFAFGPNRRLGMREIMGYAVVHPDGSVRTQVAADVPFTLELVNAAGQRVSARHRHWLQVRPGEELRCVGCHERDNELPHGTLSRDAQSSNRGAPFPNTNFAALANGETLAEAVAASGVPPLQNFVMRHEDVWTDAAVRAPDAEVVLSYANLDTAVPLVNDCQTNWQASCRALIHYPEHIAPLWSLDRAILDAADVLIEDRTCTTCHGPVDGDGLAQIPAAQLDLDSRPSDGNADQMTSYRELLIRDNEQEVIDGVLLDRLIDLLDAQGNVVFLRDDDDELVLDADDNPIPIQVTVPVAATASSAGAVASARFFAVFAEGASHADYLSPAELRLISEWLDLGAQYYNDPFVVPDA